MIVPELAIYRYFGYILEWVKTDLTTAATDGDTWLYKLFENGGLQLQNFNYFQEAKELFIRDKGHPKRLELRFFFDRERASLPTIHLNLPNEGEALQGLGTGSGVFGPLTFGAPTITHTQDVLRKSYQTSYNFIITGQTSFEVLTIYHTLKALTSITKEILQCYGFYNIQISGADLNLLSDIVPETTFFRALNFSGYYDTQVPAINLKPLIDKVELCSTEIYFD